MVCLVGSLRAVGTGLWGSRVDRTIIGAAVPHVLWTETVFSQLLRKYCRGSGGGDGGIFSFCLFARRGFVSVSERTRGKKYKRIRGKIMYLRRKQIYIYKVGHRYNRQVTYLYYNSYISTPLCGVKLANLAPYRPVCSKNCTVPI